MRKNPKDLLFYSFNMGIQLEIPQKLITESLLEGGERLAMLCEIIKKANEFAEKYSPELKINNTDSDTNK